MFAFYNKSFWYNCVQTINLINIYVLMISYHSKSLEIIAHHENPRNKYTVVIYVIYYWNSNYYKNALKVQLCHLYYFISLQGR